MRHLFSPARIAAVSVFALCCCLCSPTPAAAQDTPALSCKPAALDVRPEFYNGPDDYFTVALNLRNVSENACVPELPLFFPQFAHTENPSFKPFDLCDACEDRLPDGTLRGRPPLLLSPGETAHQTFRWKTSPPSPTVVCQQLAALGGPEAFLVVPSLLQRVCSDIEVSRYYPGAFPGLRASNDTALAEQADPEAFVLSSSKPRYYAEEQLFLHVGLALPGAGAPTADPCPTLLLRVRGPDGSARLDEAHPAGFKTCQWYTPGANRNADWQSGFDVSSGGTIGTNSYQVFEVVGSTEAGRVLFARSNELNVEIADPALITRKWMGKSKGVGVDVTLDKETYQVGEDVPLHIAIENFDAPVPVYAVDPAWDPCSAFGLEVRTLQGQLLPESGRSSRGLCMGHGFGPRPQPLGKLVPVERSLRNEGWLPTQPGVYTLVITWATCTASAQRDPDSQPPLQPAVKPYATVQAVATFRIIADPASARR